MGGLTAMSYLGGNLKEKVVLDVASRFSFARHDGGL
jgi:hypothetical protein